MGYPAPTTIVVDLCSTSAVDIACRLGSLVSFLEAAEELQTCDSLSSFAFRRHSRKIISLVEVARTTLTAAGISLHMFCSCASALSPFKTAYVKLLELLKRRRPDIDVTQQERVRQLLRPLSSGFTILRRGDPKLRLTTLPQLSASSSVQRIYERERVETPTFQLSTLTSRDHNYLMPPPDAFPAILPKRGKGASPPRRRGRLWDPEMFTPPNPRRRSRSPDIERENEAPPYRFARPVPRRFGIFCTGKPSNSMLSLSQERVGRSRAPRSLARD